MNDRPILQAALFVAGLAAFVFLMYGLYQEGFLGPFLTAGVGAILLWPIRELRAVQGLFWAGGTLFVLWMVSNVSHILIPFGVVYILAYLFNPVVSRLKDRWGAPRWATALAIALALIGAGVLALLLIVPNLATELSTLASRLLRFFNRLQTELPNHPVVSYLVEQGIVDRETLQLQIAELLPQQLDQIAASLPDAVGQVLESVGSITSGIVILAVLPVLFFYMLKDYPRIEDALVSLFPTFHGKRDYLLAAGRVVGKYLRGQLTISAIAAINVSVLLLLLDVPFGLLIGLLAGVMNMIPNFGAILTGLAGVALAIVFGDPWLVDALSVVAVLFGQSILETTILAPNILSYQVGVHPVLVLLSLFVFGSFFGVIGLLVAVPTTALLATAYRAYQEKITPELSTYNETASP